MRAIQPLSALSFGVLALLVNPSTGNGPQPRGSTPPKPKPCSGRLKSVADSVHENNGRWMPCTDERELHQQLRKQ